MTRWRYHPMLTFPQRPVNGPDACVFHRDTCRQSSTSELLLSGTGNCSEWGEMGFGEDGL